MVFWKKYYFCKILMSLLFPEKCPIMKTIVLHLLETSIFVQKRDMFNQQRYISIQKDTFFNNKSVSFNKNITLLNNNTSLRKFCYLEEQHLKVLYLSKNGAKLRLKYTSLIISVHLSKTAHHSTKHHICYQHQCMF